MATLQSLPTEILFNILNYTSPFNANQYWYPLYSIAATNKHFHGICEGYARGLLKVHANLTPKPTASISYRRKWRKWLLNTCQDCKRASKRRSILAPDMTMCKACDAKTPKITMTEAETSYHLSKLDLFTPNILHPNLPPLTSNQYMCMGSTTILILKSDVIARQKLITDLLSATCSPTDTPALRRRVGAHDRIAQASDLAFRNGRWRVAGRFSPQADLLGNMKVKSWRTREGREEYVNEQLKKEWQAMGRQWRSTGSGGVAMIF